MSKEICEFDALDNRYEKAIKLFDSTIEVYKIKREDLIDVQRFDAFYDEFETILKSIIDEYGDKVKILCNVSSGTPAMKGALQVISALTKYDIIPIQVDDPTKGKKKRDVDLGNYNVQDYWDDNLDNLEMTNRTYLSENDDFNVRIQKEIIVNFLRSYDYEAAYRVANTYQTKFSPFSLTLLRFAKVRSTFDIQRALQIQKQIPERLMPYQDERKDLFEYALILNNYVKRGEVVSFLRGLNPFLYNVLLTLFIKYYGFNLEDYCKDDWLDRDLLLSDQQGQSILSQLESDGRVFTSTFITEEMLWRLVRNHITTNTLHNGVRKLNDLRREKRNPVSHQMICIKEEDILGDMGFSTQEYMHFIKDIMDNFDYDVQEYWSSYEDMNDYIIDRLK